MAKLKGFYTDKQGRKRPITARKATVGTLQKGTAHLGIPKNISKHNSHPSVQDKYVIEGWHGRYDEQGKRVDFTLTTKLSHWKVGKERVGGVIYDHEKRKLLVFPIDSQHEAVAEAAGYNTLVDKSHNIIYEPMLTRFIIDGSAENPEYRVYTPHFTKKASDGYPALSAKFLKILLAENLISADDNVKIHFEKDGTPNFHGVQYPVKEAIQRLEILGKEG
jgi:hypothetical protein